ncbi:MAG: hypothetical protein K0R01_1918, partial [Mycobacterium sp.]|nr:hypothetical protein [Mycobacterium sp.]
MAEETSPDSHREAVERVRDART